MPNDKSPVPLENPDRSRGGNSNQRPSVLEIIGKVILVLIALAVAAALLGALVLGTCVLLMK
jgi:hypothetical protein